MSWPLRNRLLKSFAAALALAFICPAIKAAPPQTLNYQGYLTNASGVPVNSAVTSITFKIYDAATGGAELYSETQAVAVTNGQFNVQIGSTIPISLPFDIPYFLGIKVAGDPVMTPRQPISSSAYAFRAGKADSLTGNATADNLTIGGQVNISNSSPISFGGNFFLHMQGTDNTGVGSLALGGITTGTRNTAVGKNALRQNSNGEFNTAAGAFALAASTSGNSNTGLGANALPLNTTGNNNTAVGAQTITLNLIGSNNTAIGHGALLTGTSNHNTAVGTFAMLDTTTGNENTAIGRNALFANTTGSRNIALGHAAGSNLTSGNDNIIIANVGQAGDNRVIRIGTQGTHLFTSIAGIYGTFANDAREVTIGPSGLLGATTTVQRGEASVGGGSAGVNVYTVNFPTAFTAAPKVIVTPKIDLFGGVEINDTFTVTVRAISSTQFKVNVYRVDTSGGGWSSNLRLEWQAWN